MAVDKDKNTQILVTFPNEMVNEIEQFWHDNKLKNRSEAIRDLVAKGLQSQKLGKVEQEE
ncbi:ribbon-helix-helix domain-containing protein [Paenibacillus macerans]|uniref:ribbon-helix-helix domain-containing protein n=1 Tax=Paenibacillus macerans TaxID=44252 RepID=UPI00290D92F2|nr:ribbon-helix-helix domain-containing protein [Paenibacillus macerans]MDU5945477.1 ribbon-helix-helix domain-containing protein [Paenibacillus macerans]MEC0140453.1 ribbon-helix-helix domain-containing protein [Paenibacillus macerans]